MEISHLTAALIENTLFPVVNCQYLLAALWLTVIPVHLVFKACSTPPVEQEEIKVWYLTDGWWFESFEWYDFDYDLDPIPPLHQWSWETMGRTEMTETKWVEEMRWGGEKKKGENRATKVMRMGTFEREVIADNRAGTKVSRGKRDETMARWKDQRERNEKKV